MEYNNKKTIEECSFFEKRTFLINDKFFKFQLKILILAMIFVIIPCLIAINLCFENYKIVMGIFMVLVIFIFVFIQLAVRINYILRVYSDCIRNTDKAKRTYNIFKRLEFNEFIQFYEMQKGTFNLSPSEYLKVYNEKLLDNSFLFTKNSKYILAMFFYYQILASLNEIILKSETEYEIILFNRMKKLNKIQKSRFKRVQENIGSLILEKVVLAYKEKDYNKIFENIKEYFIKGVFTKYDLRKTILVLLYISAKKSGNEIDFLPKIGKKRLEEALQEEEFLKFVQRELGGV